MALSGGHKAVSGRLRDMNFSLNSMALHPCRCIDSISKELETRSWIRDKIRATIAVRFGRNIFVESFPKVKRYLPVTSQNSSSDRA